MVNKEGLINYLIKDGKKEEDSWDDLAIKFGYKSGEAARVVWKSFRKKKKTKEVHDLEGLVASTGIDTEIWNIDKYTQNFWGNKDNPNWQVKASLVPKKEDEVDRLERVLTDYKTTYIPLSQREILINDNYIKPVCAFVSLADPHIDKRTLDKTTIEDKVKTYKKVLDDLMYRVYKSHKIEEIVYVLGNDYFTSDNYFPSTTKGTPQHVTDEYDDSYEKGFDLAVESILRLRQLCEKLSVIFVPANHDRTKSFYLLHALEVYFKTDPKIVFDRTAENTKVYTYGVTMIGLHHGDTIIEKMPLYFASKYRKEWGNAKYTEIATADKHHKKQWSFKLSTDEVASTRMFISPSLTSADVWHKDKNYDLSILAGTVRIYDKEKGFIGELEERI